MTSTASPHDERTREGSPARATMTAIVHRRYGRPGPGVVELREVAVPVPDDDQVLVRVRASSVNPVEWYGVTGPYFARVGAGWRAPKDPRVGADLAGVVEAVGQDVEGLAPGDEVFGSGVGAWAEYAVASGTRLAPKPANVSFEEAACVPIAGLTALQALRDHGFTDRQIVDIALAAAVRNYFSRALQALAVPVEEVPGLSPRLAAALLSPVSEA